jgi:hypothetical protein
MKRRIQQVATVNFNSRIVITTPNKYYRKIIWRFGLDISAPGEKSVAKFCGDCNVTMVHIKGG